MQKRRIFLLSMMVLILCFYIKVPGYAADLIWSEGEVDYPIPENTVVLANAADARFSRDFSTLLKHLRLEWVVLTDPEVPESLHDKHIILLGHPDAVNSGDIIQALLPEEEIIILRNTTDEYIIHEIESPWQAGNRIFICSGADLLLRRNAAEFVVQQIIADAPPASDWIRTTYDFESSDGFRDYVSQLQYGWEDIELPVSDLMIDVDAKSPARITAQQAVEDVDRLFYLLSHGYSGYAFFNQDGAFELAKSNIFEEIFSKSSWTKGALSKLIHENLNFIVDGHLNIGDYRFADHLDFWYDTQFELSPDTDGYQFIMDGSRYITVTINGSDPADFLFPSLNQEGEPIYRMGLLSKVKPTPLNLIARNEEGEYQFDVKLQRSDFKYYADDIFREDLVGGIPVIRVRSFGDSYPEELDKFLETARNHRGEPVVIVDIRGNGGGNEHWPISWIQGLTGRRAEAVFATSELESKTSIAGRANAFIYWDNSVSDPSLFSSEAKLFTQRAERFEVGQRQPGWTEVRYPDNTLISNDTTVVLITNNLVASAGEGLVMRLSQAENVLVVGENTMGCLTFGNVSLHKLPNSQLTVWMPINFSIFEDQEFREEIGLTPDLWVPAEDAVNFTVAAIRRVTITTSQPLSEDILTQEFEPESAWHRIIQMPTKSWLVIIAFTVGGAFWAYLLRKKTPILLAIGGGWIAFSIFWISRRSEKFIGYSYFMIGVIWIIWGAINLVRARSKQHHNA